MKTLNKITFFILLINTICVVNIYSQDFKDRLVLGESYAKKELQKSLNDNKVHNVISNKTILLKDKETAIMIAETILFKIYGKENIVGERPYEVYNIDNYWVIIGTLPKGYDGGTFFIAIDSHDCKIIRITHGK
jgi:hypothetical protein